MKTLILSHGDADGVTAAAIAKSVLGGEVVFTHPAGLLGDFREFAKGFERVVILDISLDEATLPLLEEELRAFPGKVIYIDHHPLPPSGALSAPNLEFFHEEGPCTAELVFRFLQPSWEMSRVALYGAIGDYALVSPWVMRALEKWDIKSLFMQAGVLVLALDGLGRNYQAKRAVVESLARNELPSKIPGLLQLAAEQSAAIEKMRLMLPELVKTTDLLAFVINPPASVGLAAFYAAVITAKPVGVSVEEKKGMYVGSVRTRDPRINLNSALREIAVKVGGSGGGHPFAAGFRIPTEKLSNFLLLLEEAISKQLKAGASVNTSLPSTEL